MPTFTLKTENYERIDAEIKGYIAAGGHEVVIRKHDDGIKSRQRALANIWYGTIAKEQGISVGAAEAYCKYRFGLRLAEMQDADRGQMFRLMLKAHDYEQKLEIIEDLSDLFPVLRANGGLTSENTGIYLSQIQQHFAEQGVVLTSPKERELLNCREANK